MYQVSFPLREVFVNSGPITYFLDDLPATRSRPRIVGEYSIEGKNKDRMFSSLHCNFAYCDLACFRMGMSGSASFQSANAEVSPRKGNVPVAIS